VAGVASITPGGRYPVARRSRRLLARNWAYVPAAGGPIGAGMIKLGGGSTAWAVTVALVPYAVATLLLAPIAVGYFLALARYRRGKPADLAAGERLIRTLTCALIAILTLSRPEFPAEPGPPRRPGKVRPVNGGRAQPPRRPADNTAPHAGAAPRPSDSAAPLDLASPGLPVSGQGGFAALIGAVDGGGLEVGGLEVDERETGRSPGSGIRPLLLRPEAEVRAEHAASQPGQSAGRILASDSATPLFLMDPGDHHHEDEREHDGDGGDG
jgi:hypothetical protein